MSEIDDGGPYNGIDWQASYAALTAKYEAERAAREAAEAALREILDVDVKDRGYGPERVTSGDGHARCVAIACGALWALVPKSVAAIEGAPK